MPRNRLRGEAKARSETISQLFAALPRKSQEAGTLEDAIAGYLVALSDIPPGWLAQGALDAMRTSTQDDPWAPTPGELRRRVALVYARFKRREAGQNPERTDTGRAITANAAEVEVYLDALKRRNAGQDVAILEARAQPSGAMLPAPVYAQIEPGERPAPLPRIQLEPFTEGGLRPQCAFNRFARVQCPKPAETRRLWPDESPAQTALPVCEFHAMAVGAAVFPFATVDEAELIDDEPPNLLSDGA